MSTTEQPAMVPTYGKGAELKGLIVGAHKALDDLLSDDMARHGLSIGEADVLTVVLMCEDPPTPSEIASWLSVTTAGMTGRLNTLDRRGLIERRPNPADGRSLTVHLTPTGRALADAVTVAKDDALLARVVDALGPKTDALLDGLAALISIANESRTNHTS